MRYRLTLLVGAAALSSPAFASFDMMIIPDASGERYVRYDPINRVALGQINIVGGQRVTATSGNSIGIYQSPTGHASIDNYTSQLSGYPSTNLNDTFSIHSGNGSVARINSNNLSIGNISNPNTFQTTATWTRPSTLTIRGVTPVGTSSWLVYGTTSAGLDVFHVNEIGVTTAARSNVIAIADLALIAGNLGQAAAAQSNGIWSVAIPYRQPGGAHLLASFTVGTTSIGGDTFTASLNNFSTASSTTMLAALPGHNGIFVIGADATTPTLTRISAFNNRSTFGFLSTHTTSAVSPNTTSGNWRAANIVAPEPGTLAALGLGALALLRKRSRARS